MTFGRHGTFYIRNGWILKILDAVNSDEGIFQNPQAPEILGVGKNMVTSMRFWATASKLCYEKRKGNLFEYYLTDFGKFVIKYDRYLEKIETIWLIHVFFASNIKKTSTWYWLYNEFPASHFRKEVFNENIKPWLNNNFEKLGISSAKVSETTIKRDLDCFINTYTKKEDSVNPEAHISSPLAILGLIDVYANNVVFNQKYDNEIPILVFEYVLVSFMTNNVEDGSTKKDLEISIIALLNKPMSPGKLLRCTTNSLFNLLSTSINQKRIKDLKLTRTAGLDIVSISASNKKLPILKEIYGGN